MHYFLNMNFFKVYCDRNSINFERTLHIYIIFWDVDLAYGIFF